MAEAFAACCIIAILFVLYLRKKSPYTCSAEAEHYWNSACASGRLFEEAYYGKHLDDLKIKDIRKQHMDIIKAEKAFKDPKMKYAYRRLIRNNRRFIRQLIVKRG